MNTFTIQGEQGVKIIGPSHSEPCSLEELGIPSADLIRPVSGDEFASRLEIESQTKADHSFDRYVKAMSAFNETSGGALVKPPEQKSIGNSVGLIKNWLKTDRSNLSELNRAVESLGSLSFDELKEVGSQIGVPIYERSKTRAIEQIKNWLDRIATSAQQSSFDFKSKELSRTRKNDRDQVISLLERMGEAELHSKRRFLLPQDRERTMDTGELRRRLWGLWLARLVGSEQLVGKSICTPSPFGQKNLSGLKELRNKYRKAIVRNAHGQWLVVDGAGWPVAGPFLNREEAENEAGKLGLKSFYIKAGFTGTRKDKLGRTMCYANGVRVGCKPKVAPKPRQSGTAKKPVQKRPVKLQAVSEGDKVSFDYLGSEIEGEVTKIQGDKLKVRDDSGEERVVSSSSVKKAEPKKLTIDDLAQASDQALNDAYGYGLSKPGTFGYEANKGSASKFAKAVKKTNDVEKLAAAIHEGWGEVAKTYDDPVYATKPEKKQNRLKLADTKYDKLSEEEKVKDRVVALALLSKIRPKEHWGSKKQPFYRPGPNPTVDNVITRDNPKTGKKEILLIQRRKGTTEGGKWALPGGFHDTEAKKGEPWKPGKETPQQAALRELAEETGLDAKELEGIMKHVGEFGKRGRDPRDNGESWSVSNAYAIHLPKEMAEAAVTGMDDAQAAKWVSVSELSRKPLAFDHKQILQNAGIVEKKKGILKVSPSPLRKRKSLDIKKYQHLLPG